MTQCVWRVIKISRSLFYFTFIISSSWVYGATITIANDSNFYNTVFGDGDTLLFEGNANFYPSIGQSNVNQSGSLTLQSQNGNSTINLSNGSLSSSFVGSNLGLTIIANKGIVLTGGNKTRGSLFYSNGDLTFGGNDTLTFDNNRASAGLAGSVIYMDGSGTLTFNSPTTVISNNIGRGSGGSVWIHETVRMLVTGNLTLTNNIGNVNGSATVSSGGYGGALRLGQDTVSGNIINSYAFEAKGNNVITLTNNVAGMGGGGINASGSIRIEGTVIANENRALGESGAALRAVDFDTSGIELANSSTTHVFNNNKAGNTVLSAGSGRGGAIVAKRGVFIAGSATFEGNTARNGGGAIAAILGNNTLNTGNVILGNPNARLTFKANKAGYNTQGTMNISGYGGAIHAINNISMEASTLEFIDNIATSSGGALFSNNKITITGGLIAEKNYAFNNNGFGGFIFANELALTATADTYITNNMSGGKGGAIYLWGLQGNNSIYAEGGDIVFSGNRSNVTFSGNVPNVGSGNANALFIYSATMDFKANEGKTLSFLDPVIGNLNNVSTIKINSGGETGTIRFSGENYTKGSQDTRSLILANTTVYSGIFEVKDNAEYGVSIAGNQFSVNAPALLKSTATHEGVKNIINAGAFILSGVTQFYGSVPQHFVLNGHVDNMGSIIMATDGRYNTLEITGNYTGYHGLISLNTHLGNEFSPTDLVMVGGDVSGNTTLHIKNTDGLGEQTNGYGIKIVDVGGISTSTAFNLDNTLVTGAYEYVLFHAPDQSWYLSSSYDSPILPPINPPVNPGPGPIGPTLPIIPGLNLPDGRIPLYRTDVGVNLGNQVSIVNSMVPGFINNRAPNGIIGSVVMRSDIRIGAGDFFNDGDYAASITPSEEKSNTLWAFVTADKAKYKALGGQINYQTKSYILHIGGDRALAIGNKGLLITGLMANMSQVDTKSLSRLTGSRADGNVDGYGVGAYASWYFDRDALLSFAIDASLLYGRYDNEVKTKNNTPANYKSNAWSFTLQGGYPLSLTPTIAVEPQMQLTYVDYRANDYYDHGGTHVSHKLKNNVVSRIGAYIYGHGYTIKPYTALNLWYDSTRSTVGYRRNNGYVNHTTNLSSDKSGFIAEAKIGFQTQTSRNLTLWADLSARKGKNIYNNFGGAFGIKYSW